MSCEDRRPPYKLIDLITICREDLDDLPGDVVDDADKHWQNDDSGLLWSNSELTRYANEAEHEFCLRRPIRDDNKTAITDIAVTADDPYYDYSNRILSVHRVKYVDDNGDEVVLRKRTHQQLDLHTPDWQTLDSATPCFYVENSEHKEIKISPPPELGGNLELVVDRLPFQDMLWSRRDTRGPEINMEHHNDLIQYMLFKAYSKRDAETEDPKLAKKHMDAFDARVGDRPTARLLRVRSYMCCSH